MLHTESDKQKLRRDALDLFAHLRSSSPTSSNQRAANSDPRPKNTLPPYNTEVTLAYAAALLPSVYAATLHVLSEAAKRLDDFAPSKILDYGSGTSSAAWVAKQIWPDVFQNYVAYDAAKPMQWLAAKLLPPGLRTKLYHTDFITGPFDTPNGASEPTIALAAFTLSELGHPKKRTKLVDRLWESNAEVIVLVDRGTPSGFSCIADARAQLLGLSRGAGHIVAPCPHDKQCPLRFSRDFCHFAQRCQSNLIFRSLRSSRF